jgi:hypothetical protein
MLRAPGNGSCIQASLNASKLIKGHMIVDKPKGYMGKLAEGKPLQD